MKIRWFTILGFLTLMCGRVACAQSPDNMIYNPSFEQHVRCPERIDALGIMSEVEGWWQPTAGSSDYFNLCGGRESSVPRNKLGFQQAHSGDAYCGIYCSQEHYREYLQTELRHPLVKGGRYRVSFWVSLADKSPHAVATLGALFSPERVADTTYNILMNREITGMGVGRQAISTAYVPQVVNETVLDDMKGWTEVSGEFVAEGGERFLTIGNFFPFNRSTVVPIDNANAVLQGAYYYIDDVSLVCLDTVAAEPVEPAVTIPSVGDVVTMWGVYFATDKSEVLPQSYNELQLLLEMLMAHPTMKIELRGHTDNQGTIAHNNSLSEARAKAVVDYLVEHGIDRQRLSWHGYGKDMPVSDNSTPKGRSLNRRVEYRVVEL